jgi:F0F1-type ATP synthase membrane subunit c/vacuolar-type H+-ATPase subunit K
MKMIATGLASALAIAIALPAVAQTTTAQSGTELNVRSEPTPFGEILGVLETNQEVTIDGCLQDVSWCKVSSGGMTGWASGQYLYVEDNANAVPLIDMAGNAEQFTVIEQTVETTTEADQDIAAVSVGTLGALTAFALGGPVGAIVASGVAGTVLGAAAVEPSEETVTFIVNNPVETVYLEGEVVVGALVPTEVPTFEVPQAELRYLTINNVPVVVDAETGTIVRVIR